MGLGKSLYENAPEHIGAVYLISSPCHVWNLKVPFIEVVVSAKNSFYLDLLECIPHRHI